MHVRTALVTVIIAASTLTACAGGTQQGKAERASTTASKSPDCGPNSTLSQSDWIDQCSSASATPAEKKPDTELAVGDTFAYKDGLKVTITGINKITQYGEYDDRPDAAHAAFRVKLSVTNGTTRPYDLDNLGYNAEGATKGGETEFISVEPGSKQMTGRLAPNHTGAFTAEYSIAKTDGNTIVFTVSRMDDAFLKDDSAYLGDDPNWTGEIK
ncbi:hypothetical protein ACIRP3_42720 [Streptomyces sp. NPDC101209]|uniref:hypothetical protein n=1 Tax=Streptomyces sp. NPDC101209 TaxID=3366129 RepID=UPI00382BDD23